MKTRAKPRAAQRGAKAGNGIFPSRLSQIAKWIGGSVVGDGQTVITGLCGIREASRGQLTFIANSKYEPLLELTKASAVITSKDVRSAPLPIIQSDNPSLAFAKLASLAHPEAEDHPQGISSKALIAKGVRIGKGAAVQAFAVIEEGAEIGDRSVIYSGCHIGRKTRIGNDCLIYPNVTVRERVEIGHRVIIHSGTAVGCDGFGFATVEGVHHKIPQIGIVVIEDDVEIGANVTIDRARFGKTIIGKGTKIDNLVQIAHNVVIGPNCIIVAQVGISGSTTLGKNVVLAGQSGVVGHITIGDNVMVGAQAGVSKSVPANSQVWGYPAKLLSRAKRVNAATQRLPELYQKVEELEKRVSKERGRNG